MQKHPYPHPSHRPVPPEVAAVAPERSEGAAAAAQGGFLCPPSVKRGESPFPDFEASIYSEAEPKTKIDWLNFTFKTAIFDNEDKDLADYTKLNFIQFVVDSFSDILGRDVFFEKNEKGSGSPGYKYGGKLTTRAASKTYEIGTLGWGGVQQRGTCLVSLSGGGCSLFNDFSAVVAFLGSVNARITRVDLALDFYDGKFTVDDAVNFYHDGGFTNSGRPPSVSQAGDWINGVARTFYVGRRANGKFCRIYEKGHQLGDFSSNWTRFEVQLGNRDRVLEYEILTNPDKFFKGSYPAFEKLIDCVSQKIKTVKKSAEKTLAHLLTHLKRSYGKAVNLLSEKCDFDLSEFMEQILVPGLPRRVNVAEYESGFTWKDCLTQLQRRGIYAH